MTGLPDADASRAVLIGVHGYETLDDLPAVEQNLTGLRDVFTDPALWGLPEGNCVLAPQPPTARTVLDTVWETAAQATDALIVYYAGHGLTDPHTDELCLALPDSDPERPYTALPYESLRRVILGAGGRARRKVVILDCCYSGRALVGGMSASSRVADQAVVDGTYLLTASAETRKALAPPGERYTAFTGELISTLSEGLPGGPDFLDMETVYRQLHTRLSARSRPLPQQRNRNAGARIALVRNANRTADPEPSPPPSPPGPPAAQDPWGAVHQGAALLASKIAGTLGPSPATVYAHSDGYLITTTDPAVICEITTATELEAQFGAAIGMEAQFGAELVRALVHRMRAEWSDGAATAVVMAEAMIRRAFVLIRDGAASPTRLAAELNSFGDPAADLVRHSSFEIGTRERLVEAMTTMTGDPSGAAKLAEAADAVGRDGVIVVQGNSAEPGVSMRYEPYEYFLPVDPSDGERLLGHGMLEAVLLVENEPSSGDLLPEREWESPIVLRPAPGGIAMEVRSITGPVKAFLPDEFRLDTLTDIIDLTGAEPVPGTESRYRAKIPKATVDRNGLHIVHNDRSSDHRVAQLVARLRSRIDEAESPAARAALERRLSRAATGVATVLVGVPGEPGPRPERVETFVRARNVLPTLVKHGGVDGGGAALHAAADHFSGSRIDPATDVLYAGLTAPLALFMAACGPSTDRAFSMLRSMPGVNGFDLRTGRLAMMAEAGVVDSAAVLAGAVTAAVETTRQFLTLA
ncbi:caspase family protein [Actinomadura sp. 3N508]|uniref:caspase, EACC1-associated type n=1 Tax=Actinomadura sp. 3N508 TaxID=3375153 RepID=UPI00379A3F9A